MSNVTFNVDSVVQRPSDASPEDLLAQAQVAAASSVAVEDPDFPLFHVAPPVGRLNDPNGLVWRDGQYHAFYQFSPFHPERKLVFWGHASSEDLTHWRTHAPALAPSDWYDRNGVYSGSAVPLDDRVEFFYTGNVRPSDDTREAYQCVAISPSLEQFDKIDANPLIDQLPPGCTAHVRDPQVFRDADGSYRMCLGAQRLDQTGCVVLYRSQDLRRWEYEGELQFPDAPTSLDSFGYMWECPNLVKVPDEITGQLHDVLIFCPQGIPPQSEGFDNTFACGYLIGRLDGTHLRETGPFLELDRGFEFYAPQVFAGLVDRPQVMMGWVGNAGEDDLPSAQHGWVHTLSLARELVIREGRLIQRPVINREFCTDTLALGPQQIDSALTLVPDSRSFVAELVVDPHPTQDWIVRLGSRDSHIDLRFTPTELTVDRSATRYPQPPERTIKLPASDQVSLLVSHDRSVTEIFLNDGHIAFSLRSFLDSDASGIALIGPDLQLKQARVTRFD